MGIDKSKIRSKERFNLTTKDSKDIESIINRVKNSEYISRSMSDKLSRITNVNNFGEILNNKVDSIVGFISKYKLLYIDDLLVEFFDGSGYSYEISSGVYFDKSSYEKKRLLLTKNDYTYTKILESIITLLKQESPKYGYADKFYYDSYNPSNSFKKIESVSYYVNINIVSKQYKEYEEGSIAFYGWTDQNVKFICDQIQSRISYKIKPCIVFPDSNWSSYVSPVPGDRTNSTRTFLLGKFFIDFKKFD